MASQQYDVVVVGAGPSGLSAARTMARLGFSTLVVERLAAAGDLAHPCGAMIAPVPGFISAQRANDGLRFPEVDLLIPSSLVIGYPTWQRLVSPDGREFTTAFSDGQASPVAVIDKPGLLRLMAQEAEEAGAELRYGSAVIGLRGSGGRIAGVRTGEGEIAADLVLVAEGTSRQLTEEAGLYPKMPPAKRYAFVVSQELDAPAVHEEHLGQMITFGKQHTSAREAFGTVVMPAPGRASVHFTIFADGPRHHSDRSLWYYLDEYMERDPRVKGLFVGARVLGGSGHRLVLRSAPAQAVSAGLMGLGDAITPGGHLGIMPAIYTGRQAALMAAEALDAGDVTALRLAEYDRHLHGALLGNLETELRLVEGLMRMTDDELNRLCQTLHTLRQATPYFGSWRTIAWESVAWFVRQFPLVSRDWDLLQRIMNTPDLHWIPADLNPAIPSALKVAADPRV